MPCSKCVRANRECGPKYLPVETRLSRGIKDEIDEVLNILKRDAYERSTTAESVEEVVNWMDPQAALAEARRLGGGEGPPLMSMLSPGYERYSEPLGPFNQDYMQDSYALSNLTPTASNIQSTASQDPNLIPYGFDNSQNYAASQYQHNYSQPVPNYPENQLYSSMPMANYQGDQMAGLGGQTDTSDWWNQAEQQPFNY